MDGTARIADRHGLPGGAVGAPLEPKAEETTPPPAPARRGVLLANPARPDSKPASARQSIEAVVIARGGGV